MDRAGMDGAGMSKVGPVEAVQKQLYGLMELAQDHQTAVQAALDGMAAERAALRAERDGLARQVQDLQLATQGTVRRAVAESLAGAAVEGATAVRVATTPLLDRVAGVMAEAGQAEAALRRVVSWASWGMLGRGALVLALLAGLAWGAQLSVWWWTSWDTSVLQARKALLQAEVDEMQANREEWAKAGMLGKLERCGPKARPCIRVDEGAGPFGDRRDYRVIQGY